MCCRMTCLIQREVFSKAYSLILRDSKQCPKSVKRCESCKRQFSNNDSILVKTVGERDYVDKRGKFLPSHSAKIPPRSFL